MAPPAGAVCPAAPSSVIEPPAVLAVSDPPVIEPGRQYTTHGPEQCWISIRRQDAASDGSHGVVDSS